MNEPNLKLITLMIDELMHRSGQRVVAHQITAQVYLPGLDLLVVAIAVVIAQLAPLYSLLKPTKSTTVDNCESPQCELVGKGVLSNSEDLTVYRHGLVFVSAGNIAPLIGHHEVGDHFSKDGIPGGDLLAAEIADGQIVMIDVRPLLSERQTGSPVFHPLPIRGLPSTIAFHPHGIFYSNATERLYAVSHGLATGSRVIVFRVEGGGSGGSDLAALSLVYLRSVTSPELLLSLGPNDVVEGKWDTDGGGGGGEIYVTQWLKYAVPLAGKTHPHTFVEWVTTGLQELVLLDIPHRFESVRALGARWLLPKGTANPGGSSVVRCVWSSLSSPSPSSSSSTFSSEEQGEVPAVCGVVASGFVMANGITTDPERRRVFVNDIGKQAVFAFKRDQDSGGLLEQHDRRISLTHMADNIEYDAGSGTLHTGSIPRPLEALKAMKNKNTAGVPGGLQLLVRKRNQTPNSGSGDGDGDDVDQEHYEVEGDVCTHSGRLLSQISSALLVDRTEGGNSTSGGTRNQLALLGSPFSRGLLVCLI